MLLTEKYPIFENKYGVRELGIKSIFRKGGVLPRANRSYLIAYRKAHGELKEKKLYTLKHLDNFIKKLDTAEETYVYQLYLITKDRKLEKINYNKK